MNTAIWLAIMAATAQDAPAAPTQAGAALNAALEQQAEVIDRKVQRELDALIDATSTSIAISGKATPPPPPAVILHDSAKPLRLAAAPER